MTTLYEMIGIDAGDGIEESEVQAIKRVLARIQAKLAELAKDNPAHTTLALLQEVEEVVWKVVAANVHSPKELRIALGRIESDMPSTLTGGGSDSDAGFRPEDFAENLKKVLMSHEDGVSPGQIKLIGRTLGMAGAGSRIEATADGTPAELAATRNARDDYKEKLDKATEKATNLERQLEEERAKSADLKRQLEAAKDAAVDIRGVDDAQVKPAFNTLVDIGQRGVHKRHKSEFDKALKKLRDGLGYATRDSGS